MKKLLICFLVCMLVSASIGVSVAGTVLPKQVPYPLTTGNILYVGGSGPNNYTKIQDAIDNASDGDVIFVYAHSSPYHENIVVDKAITVMGEDRETTIIDADEVTPTVELMENGITLQEFTLRHQEHLQEEYMDILAVYSNNNTIKNNILTGESYRKETSIMLKNSSMNVLSNNHIEHVYDTGIELRDSHDNLISGNTITGVIWVRGFGINLIDSSNNVIKQNEISQLACCVDINELSTIVTNNQILQNNFLRYYLRMSGGYFEYDYYRFQGRRGNTFDENYWSHPRFAPKYILGWTRLFGVTSGSYRFNIRIILPMFDLHPAQEPYDIPGMT